MIDVKKLAEISLFRSSTPEALARLAESMESVQFADGETIISEGDKSGTLFIVQAGTVNVQKKIDSVGQTKIVARLNEGEIFGEMSFLENEPHSATVVAEGVVNLFSLARKDLTALIKKDPSAAVEQVVALMSSVSHRLRRTTNELISVYQVAREMSRSTELIVTAQKITDQLVLDFNNEISVGFYRWNLFNEEFSLLSSSGDQKDIFPSEISGESKGLGFTGPELVYYHDVEFDPPDLPFSPTKGAMTVVRSDGESAREGLLIFVSPRKNHFDSGDLQLMETVAEVLAPGLASARSREEEKSRRRLESGREGSVI